MSRKKKILCIAIVIALVVDILISIYTPIVFGIILNIIAISLVITPFIANAIIKRTKWYKELYVDYGHEIYPDNIWYRKYDDRKYDIVALGSSAAKYAYNFTDTGVKGMNWAQQPQSIIDDYKLFRTFHSILHKGSYVLLNIMPFSSCDKKTGVMDTFKYFGTFREIKDFDQRFYKKAIQLRDYPILLGKPAIKALLQYLTKREKTRYIQPDIQPMTDEMLKKDAMKFINGWKMQFGITDLDAPLTDSNKIGREIRQKTMREMIDFILERGYTPVYVIPPTTKYLSSYYSHAFKETYIYSFLKDIERNVIMLDYSNDEDLNKEELYFNSFFMNKNGASIFTKRVLKDLNLI